MSTCKNELSISYTEKNREWPQIFAIFVVSLGSLTSGIHLGWTSPSIPILTSNSSHIDQVTFLQASYLAVIQPVDIGVASPLVGLLLGYVGRKKTAIAMTIPQLSAWVAIYFGKNIYVLYLASFLGGVGQAFFFNALPVYIGEITEPHVRGLWGNLLTVTVFVGQLLINVVGSYFSIRTTAVIFGVIPIVHFLLLLLLPESPCYLLLKRKTEKAQKSLKKLRRKENVDEEIVMLRKYVQLQVSESGNFRNLFTIPANRKALIICTVARVIQQLSGLPAFAMYTQYIFNHAGGNFSGSTSSIICSLVWVFAVILFSTVSDKFGRKPLMIFSCVGCSFILAIEAIYFYFEQNTSIDVSTLTWVPLTGMILYIIFCSSGLAFIPTLLLSEMFSSIIKGKAVSFTNVCFAMFVLTSAKLFQVLSTSFGMFAPFCFYSVCCFSGIMFSYYCVPETKKKTLEEIQIMLSGDKAQT